MSILWPLTFVLLSFLQTGEAPAAVGDILDAAEKVQMEKADNIEKRIKVYEAASTRIQKNLETAVRNDDSQVVPDTLKLWIGLLSKSLEDMESNLPKKKSKALKNYEIQVRKAIGNTGSYKIRAPVEQQDIFDSSLAKAETIRKRFVEILFRH